MNEAFGPEVANQLDGFDNPEKYPNEFLDECVDFIGKLMGSDAAKRKFAPLIRKYSGGMERGAGRHYIAGGHKKPGRTAKQQNAAVAPRQRAPKSLGGFYAPHFRIHDSFFSLG